MPLLETLMIDVGGSIAKALLTRWLSNNTIVSDASSSIVDVLKNSLTDRLANSVLGTSLRPLARVCCLSLRWKGHRWMRDHVQQLRLQ